MNIISALYGTSGFVGFVRNILLKLRFHYPYNLYYMHKVRTRNPEIIKDAESFFSANRDRIDHITYILADELSRISFRKVISLRQSYKKEDIPPHDYFDQYFPKDIIHLGDEEVFVDCGAYNGDTIISFLSHSPEYRSIIAFEPSPYNFNVLESHLKGKPDIHLFQCGVAAFGGEAYLDGVDGGSNIYGTSSGEKVTLCSIDESDACKNATYIKMDIEGAEWDALHGAKQTIQHCRPKLAICLYHSHEDMLRIPEYIHELVPDYKLYVRCHTMGVAETVLYAVP